MKAKFSPVVQKRIKELNKIDSKIVLRIEKQVAQFESNPRHPSLRTHKLTGKLSNLWSISIHKDLRMVYMLLDGDVAYFVDLGTHDEVYRK